MVPIFKNNPTCANVNLLGGEEIHVNEKTKAVSVYVTFPENEKVYVFVETEDIDKAKETARKWAEDKTGKLSEKVKINQGLMDSPDMEHQDEINGLRIWELPF